MIEVKAGYKQTEVVVIPRDWEVKKSDINNRKSMGLQKPGVIIPAPVALIDMPKGYESFQQSEGWGAKIIDRLSHDLKAAFPDMSGFSPRNLKYMRKFAQACRQRNSATHRCTNSVAP